MRVTTISLSDPSLKDLPAAPATPRKSIFGVFFGVAKMFWVKNRKKTWQVILNNTVRSPVKVGPFAKKPGHFHRACRHSAKFEAY